MAEENTTADEGAATATDEQHSSDELGDAGRRALQEERQKAREATKQLRAVNAELEKLRTAAMTETERAVAEAKQAGATEAARASAPRLVRAELRAAAAEVGLPREALAGFLEYADLTKFVSADGEPDEKAIAAAVTRLGGASTTDFDGGARRTAAQPASMSALIRRQAGLA